MAVFLFQIWGSLHGPELSWGPVQSSAPFCCWKLLAPREGSGQKAESWGASQGNGALRTELGPMAHPPNPPLG